jgi:hypothetical protein
VYASGQPKLFSFRSELLYVPSLKEPGYGNVQVGIYIATLEDVVHRLGLDNSAKLITKKQQRWRVWKRWRSKCQAGSKSPKESNEAELSVGHK